MISLLLDSSNTNLSVGIGVDHKLVDGVSFEAWQRQSELMVDEIDKLLKKNKIDKKSIDEVVCSKGPGSYTGVRIALTIAKVMSLALNIPLYLVSSLEALKDPEAPSLCIMNARSKRSYIGVYLGGKCLLDDTIKTNDEVLAILKDHPDLVPCGDASHLGIKGRRADILKNLVKLDDEGHLCQEPLAARPVYLKDSYPA